MSSPISSGRALAGVLQLSLMLASCRSASPETPARATLSGDQTCDCSLPAQDFQRHPACLTRTGAAYQVQPGVLHSLTAHGEPGPFEVYSRCGVFWARADGLALPTVPFDNGPDPFQEGVARYLSNGKYGYMSSTLNVLLTPRYEFAYPFEGGRGVVCQGCTFQAQGEHTSVACTACGAVDHQGRLIEALGSRPSR